MTRVRNQGPTGPAAAEDEPRLLLTKGHAGAGAADICAALGGLAELTMLVVDGALDQRELALVRAHGELLIVPTIDDLLPAALDLAARCRVDGVMTVSESLLEPTAAIADRLGLRHHSPQATRRMRNKHLQRQALAAAGVPSAAFALISGRDDVVEAAGAVGFPAVLKPTNGASSALTYRVDDLDELRERYAEACALSCRAQRFQGEVPAFVLEELLIGTNWHHDERFGDYVSVESLLFDGEIHHLTVTDRTPLAPPFRETGLIVPSCLAPEHQDEIRAVATAALRALGATDGAAHTELKLTREGPRVIEVNGRLGGHMAGAFNAVAGIDCLREQAKVALGIAPDGEPDFSGYGGFLITPPPSVAEDRPSSVRGTDAVRRLPGVRRVLAREGARADWRMGRDDTLSTVIAATPTVDELLELRTAINDRLRFEPVANAAA